MNEIIFNKEKLEQLQLAYGKAMAMEEETFRFEGQEILTEYAKYMIQFLERKLGED